MSLIEHAHLLKTAEYLWSRDHISLENEEQDQTIWKHLLELKLLHSHSGLEMSLNFLKSNGRNYKGYETKAKSVWETRFM